MGMYTRINLTCKIDKADEDDLKILNTMINGTWEERVNFEVPESKKEIAFFNTPRWRSVFGSCSYYFDHIGHCNLEKDHLGWYYLLVDSDLKNYDGEIEKFIEWVKTLSTTDGFVGYWQYEEAEEPTLIYFTDATIKTCYPNCLSHKS